MHKKQPNSAVPFLMDILTAVFAGFVVGSAYHFFQNSNGFAPGGVGGLATITHHLLEDKLSWTLLMVAFNLPIFILVVAPNILRLFFIRAGSKQARSQ